MNRIEGLIVFLLIACLFTAAFAIVNVPESYYDLEDLPALFDGSYDSLSGVPDLSGFGSYDNLTGVPDLSGFGSYDNLTGVPVIDLQHGLVLHLPFDGLSLDKSGYVHSPTVSAGLVYGAGILDEAAFFDGSGTGNYTYFANDALLDITGTFTVSCWFNLRSSDGYYRSIYSKEGGSNNGIAIFSQNGYLAFYVGDGADWGGLWSWDSVDVDTWYFMVCTYGYVEGYESYMLNLYLDCDLFAYGVLQDSPASASGSPAVVGNYIDLVSRPIDGWIDDFRLYNRVLSGYEILSLYGLGT